MRKVTGFFFIAAAIFLLGNSFKPLAEEAPRLIKIDTPVIKYAEEAPRLIKIDTPVIKYAEEAPRLI